ncbi:hypothetical protein F4803DRAFT_340165 [Xylaria telfairii]|nr:hypothetical protein F4803DRAFT_340165 [Xylaria telfairii]
MPSRSECRSSKVDVTSTGTRPASCLLIIWKTVAYLALRTSGCVETGQEDHSVTSARACEVRSSTRPILAPHPPRPGVVVDSYSAQQSVLVVDAFPLHPRSLHPSSTEPTLGPSLLRCRLWHTALLCGSGSIVLPRLRTLIIPPDLFDDLTFVQTARHSYFAYRLRHVVSLKLDLPSQVRNAARLQMINPPVLTLTIVVVASALTPLAQPRPLIGDRHLSRRLDFRGLNSTAVFSTTPVTSAELCLLGICSGLAGSCRANER